SVVQVPVNAIGKNKSSVFVLPKLSLSFIRMGPSALLVERLKSGALVPVASGMVKSFVEVNGVTVKRGGAGVKEINANFRFSTFDWIHVACFPITELISDSGSPIAETKW